MTLERLAQILEDWSYYMGRPRLETAIPSKSSGFISNDSCYTEETWTHTLENHDLQNAVTLDALIDGLTRDHRNALNYRYELSRVRPPLYIHLLNQANDELCKKCIKKGLT